MQKSSQNIPKMLERLANLSDRLISDSDISSLCELAVQVVDDLVNPSDVFLMLFDLDKKTLICESHRGNPLIRRQKPQLRITGSVKDLLDSGWEILGPDLRHTDRFYLYLDPELENQACIEFRIPLFLDESHLAVLLLGKKADGTDYTVPEIDVLRMLNNLLVLCGERSIRCGKEKSRQKSVPRPVFPLFRRNDYEEILGESDSIHQVIEMVDRVAGEDVPVLITGESGTGKELIARAIHRQSRRCSRPMVAINCAALPDHLIESELFGHEKGAFTGAAQQRKGRFELANGGTLFLDEIGDISLPVQIRLLRVLQERTFERVGGDRSITVNVRIIAATSRNLEDYMRTGKFREDLYYRLNVFPIHIPPLRERRTDIILLADHFLQKYNTIHGKNVKRISTPAINMMMAYHWPGNVRELENCIERALLTTTDDVIHGYSLPPSLQTSEETNTALIPQDGANLKVMVESYERELIVDALKKHRGNAAAAARFLHTTQRIINYRIAQLGIEPRNYR